MKTPHQIKNKINELDNFNKRIDKRNAEFYLYDTQIVARADQKEKQINAHE
jgi:hypothetical protein